MGVNVICRHRKEGFWKKGVDPPTDILDELTGSSLQKIKKSIKKVNKKTNLDPHIIYYMRYLYIKYVNYI